MKPGASLSLRPPKRTSDLARLQQLEDWTQEPATAQIAAIEAGGPSEPAKTDLREGPRKRAAGAGKGSGKGAPAALEPARFPWLEPGVGGSKPTNFRLPMDLFLQLKWLGETTYGETMTTIVIKALRQEVEKRLPKQGAANG